MAATLRDVAELAGVSFRTVSNVVNDYPYISAATRTKVQAAIDELGYTPNHAARSLRLGRSNTLGLAVPSLKVGYLAELASDIIDAAEARGFVVLVEQTDDDRERELDAVHGSLRRLTDGLLLSPIAIGQEDEERLVGGHPLVLLGENVFSSRLDHVTLRNAEAARAATRLLLDSGHRRIAVVGRDPSGLRVGSAELRLEGYRAALAETGVPFDPALVVSPGRWTHEDGSRAVSDLLDTGVRFDALFAFTDLLAIGAMHELRARGLRVPDDVSVLGFDDLTEGRWVTPALSTVDSGRHRIAVLAVDTMISRIAEPAAPARLIEVDYGIVERGSTAPRRA